MTEPSARDRELAEQLKPLLLNATIPWEECAAKLATLLAAARAEGAAESGNAPMFADRAPAPPLTAKEIAALRAHCFPAHGMKLDRLLERNRALKRKPVRWKKRRKSGG